MTEYTVTAFSSRPGSLIRVGYTYSRAPAAAHRAVRELSPDCDDPPTVWVRVNSQAHWVEPSYWEGGIDGRTGRYDLRRIDAAEYDYAFARLAE